MGSMLAFCALGAAVVVLIVVNEWNIRSVRASRRSLLVSNIRLLELDLGVGEPEPNPFVMTDEPGQMIQIEDPAIASRPWGYPPPPPSQWYERYQQQMRNPRLYRDDSQDRLEVW